MTHPGDEVRQYVGPGDGPHHPGLEVELEDGVHAGAEDVAQVDVLDAKREESAGGKEEEDKIAS